MDGLPATSPSCSTPFWGQCSGMFTKARATRQTELGDDSYDLDVGPVVSVEPIFVVSDVARAVAHYEQLGFSTSHHDEGYARG